LLDKTTDYRGGLIIKLLKAMKFLALIIGSILVIGLSLPNRPDSAISSDPIYLPNGKALDVISFGYTNAVSDYLWMKTISYFGEHYKSDKQYKWFEHQCKLVTKLNPRSFEPFYLCVSLLAFEANDPNAAIGLLDDAVKAQPNTWIFFYFRGFYRLYFNHDNEGARNDFIEASKRPDAHPIAARLAGKSMSELDSPESAIQFLNSAVRNTKDESAKKALQDRLNEIIYERDLDNLAEAIAKLPGASSVEELVSAKIYQGSLTDPYGGTYIIRDGKVESTSRHKRLSEYRGIKRKP